MVLLETGGRFRSRLFGPAFSAILQSMTSTSTGREQVIDLTGLPEKAAEAVRTLVEALRQQAATHPPAPPSADDWQRLFDAYLREVAARAGCYPEGFVVDDSRETIYESRGE
jgi:hypothetical protein